MIYIKKVIVSYSNSNLNKELLISYIGKSYLKSINENTSKEFTKKIFTFESLLNETFPNYSDITEEIIDSNPIINYYGFNDLPNMELINGELISDINISENYEFISNKNYNSTYKYLSYNIEYDEIIIMDNNYPGNLPNTNFITIFFDKDTLVESSGYIYEGIITLGNTSTGVYEYNLNSRIGNLDPNDDTIISLYFNTINAEVILTTSTRFTFRKIEITMNDTIEILENTNLNEILINF